MGSLRSGARKRYVSWKKATETASTGYMRKGRAFALPFCLEMKMLFRLRHGSGEDVFERRGLLIA
jgi:hypothetical protein